MKDIGKSNVHIERKKFSMSIKQKNETVSVKDLDPYSKDLFYCSLYIPDGCRVAWGQDDCRAWGQDLGNSNYTRFEICRLMTDSKHFKVRSSSIIAHCIEH
jgi:hypothetical protein